MDTGKYKVVVRHFKVRFRTYLLVVVVVVVVVVTVVVVTVVVAIVIVAVAVTAAPEGLERLVAEA